MGPPAANQALRALLCELKTTNPEDLGHLDPARVLFVAGAARLASRATVRGLGAEPGGPEIWLGGQAMAYEICLRPGYFRRCSPSQRLRVICHELWHISPAFDHRLAADRRHGATCERGFAAATERIAQRWERHHDAPPAALLPQPQLELWAWLERPPSRRLSPAERARYTEAQLYTARIEQR